MITAKQTGFFLVALTTGVVGCAMDPPERDVGTAGQASSTSKTKTCNSPSQFGSPTCVPNAKDTGDMCCGGEICVPSYGLQAGGGFCYTSRADGGACGGSGARACVYDANCCAGELCYPTDENAVFSPAFSCQARGRPLEPYALSDSGCVPGQDEHVLVVKANDGLSDGALDFDVRCSVPSGLYTYSYVTLAQGVGIRKETGDVELRFPFTSTSTADATDCRVRVGGRTAGPPRASTTERVWSDLVERNIQLGYCGRPAPTTGTSANDRGCYAGEHYLEVFNAPKDLKSAIVRCSALKDSIPARIIPTSEPDQVNLAFPFTLPADAPQGPGMQCSVQLNRSNYTADFLSLYLTFCGP